MTDIKERRDALRKYFGDKECQHCDREERCHPYRTWEACVEAGGCDYREDAEKADLAFMAEHGVVFKVEGELPLTETSKILSDHHLVHVDDKGERHFTIPVCLPEPTPEHPRTQLHIDGGYLASSLGSELRAQNGMVEAGYTLTAPLLPDGEPEKEVTP